MIWLFVSGAALLVVVFIFAKASKNWMPQCYPQDKYVGLPSQYFQSELPACKRLFFSFRIGIAVSAAAIVYGLGSVCQGLWERRRK